MFVDLYCLVGKQYACDWTTKSILIVQWHCHALPCRCGIVVLAQDNWDLVLFFKLTMKLQRVWSSYVWLMRPPRPSRNPSSQGRAVAVWSFSRVADLRCTHHACSAAKAFTPPPDPAPLESHSILQVLDNIMLIVFLVFPLIRLSIPF